MGRIPSIHSHFSNELIQIIGLRRYPWCLRSNEGPFRRYCTRCLPCRFNTSLGKITQVPTVVEKTGLVYLGRQQALWMRFWSSLSIQMETKTAPECFVKQFRESDFQKQGISDLQGAFVAGSRLCPFPMLLSTPLILTFRTSNDRSWLRNNFIIFE